jgi:manganese transport protein
MDATNWAANIAAGSAFEYSLLFVVLVSTLIAMLLQALSVRLGMATGRDLAQACKDSFSLPVVRLLWFSAELGIMATYLAEVICSAIALKLLFGIPLAAGVCLTAVDVLIVMWLQSKRFRLIELMAVLLILTIIGCFAAELGLSKPDAGGLFLGFLPSKLVVTDADALFISIGIIGGTVMPHNLYLHSSIVQTRKCDNSPAAITQGIRYFTIDSIIALMLALFVNAAIMIVAAATFYRAGEHRVELLEDGVCASLGPMFAVSSCRWLGSVCLLVFYLMNIVNISS